MNNIAYSYLRIGDLDAAVKNLREALPIARETFGHDHPNVTMAKFNLAHFLTESHEFAAAEDLAREALASSRERYPEGSLETSIALAALANSLRGQKKYEESAELYREGTAMMRQHEARASRIIARQLEYASVLTELKRYEDSERELLSVLEAVAKHFPDGPHNDGFSDPGRTVEILKLTVGPRKSTGVFEAARWPVHRGDCYHSTSRARTGAGMVAA